MCKSIVFACLVFSVGVAMQTAAVQIPLFVSTFFVHNVHCTMFWYRWLVVLSQVLELVSFLVWFLCISPNGEETSFVSLDGM